jgi:acetyl esterase/lipase
MSIRRRSELSPKIAATALVLWLALSSATTTLAADGPAAPNPTLTASAAVLLPPTYWLYAPSTLPASGPVQLLLVLHGMGDNGPSFARAFLPLANRRGWLLAAPTFAYGDYFDPAQIRREDPSLSRQIEALLADVPARSSRAIRSQILVAGFSRGAQLADRFTYFHPDQVAAVASLSAGAYTMPETVVTGDSSAPLPLPFGTADFPSVIGHPLDMDHLRQVPFWLSVGGQDNNPADVPRQWDTLLGQTRLDRAVAYEHVLRDVRVPVQLTIYPGAKHQLTGLMTDGVDQFFGAIEAVAPIGR